MAETILVTPGQAVSPPDWDTLLRQHGNLPPNAQPQIVSIKDPKIQALVIANPALAAYFQQHPPYRYYFGDGTSVIAFNMENGEDVQIVDYTPSPKFQQAQKEQEAKSPEAQSPTAQRTAREEAEIERNRNLPPDQDPYPETDADRRVRGEKNEATRKAEAAKQAALDAAAKPQAGKPYKNAKGEWVQSITDAQGNITGTRPVPPEALPADAEKDGEKAGAPFKNEAGQWVQPISDATGRVIRTEPLAPGAAPADKPPGNKYVRVEQDKETGKWSGLTQDGKWEEIPGGPGATPQAGQSPGAGLPQIIVGQSEAAIRAMDAQNAELVAAGRMTPAQRANRLQEAFQLANVAVADAGLAQRQLESGRNTGFNIANARLNHLGGGVNDALKFVMDINKNLPEGSPLGANAFVAMLTMNMAIAQASGMMDLEIPDNALTPEALARRRQQRGQPAPPPPRLTDPTNRAAIEADRQAALANPVFQATDTMDADGKPRQFTPSGSAPLPPLAPTGSVSVRPSQVAPPSAVPAAAPVRPPVPMAPAAAPVPALVGAPDDKVTITNINGQTTQVRREDLPRWLRPNIPGGTTWRVTNDPGAAAPPVSAPALAAPPQPVMPGPTTEPGGGVPDMRQVVPQPVPRAVPGGADNVQMAPPANDFPVMAQLQQPQQQMPVPEAAPAIDWSQSPAMLRTRAQTSIPWRLSDQEIEQMIAAGVPESEIWSIPGRSFG